MTNLQAALEGLAQLEQIDSFVAKKRMIGRSYNEKLSSVEGISLPLATTEFAENIYWVYSIVLLDPARSTDAESVMARLADL